MKLELAIILLKWASQALIAVIGVWSLLSDPYESDPKSGKRRLNRSGWVKVSLLAVGFLLFCLTDVDERNSSRAQREQQSQQLAIQLKTVETQARQLDYLQRLLLLQYSLSEISIVFEFPNELINRMGNAIVSYKAKSSDHNTNSDSLAYISTAARLGTVIVRYSGAGKGELQYTLNRPQGLTGGRVSDPDPEWRAFDNAFRKLFGERFEIISDSGRTLVDILNPESNMMVTFSENTVKVDIRDPGIRLDELNGSVTFVCGKDALLHIIEGFIEDDESERTKTFIPIDFGPQTIWFSSKDPRVEWNQKIQLAWMPVVNRSFQEVDTERTIELGEFNSGPNAIKANYFGFSPN